MLVEGQEIEVPWNQANKDMCIEFDGQQHYEPKFGEESFKRTQSHDIIKNEYCKSKGISLIRIPYWDGSSISEILSNELHIENKSKQTA